ncbi:hypothetical protein, partial [Micromonospora sp. NPDC048830]|uniref:hypothetical protein n=1 Tax=Micromonospora sp. NPDC048830 TaxID=3364257 RepID=UPI00371DAF39
KQILKDIANDPHDPRLPRLSPEEWERLWPLLDQMVAAEIIRLTLGESVKDPEVLERLWTLLDKKVARFLRRYLKDPRVAVIRMTADLLEPHERGRDVLEDKLGLGLAALRRRFLMELLGVYPGAVLENNQQIAVWEEDHPQYPSYSVDLETHRTSNEHPGRRPRRPRLEPQRRVKRTIAMSAENFANSIAFANTALKPGTREPDTYRTNSALLQFTVRIPDNKNKIRRQEIAVLFGMDNLFNLVINPNRVVIADYGPFYFGGKDAEKNFPPVKQEPDTTPPPT